MRLFASVIAAAMLVGCSSSTASSGLNPFKKKPDAPEPNLAAGQFPQQPDTLAAAAISPQTPYSLTAEARGNCIEFAIRNNGDVDILIDPANFAIIPSGSRQVYPYKPTLATIDVPASVRPGEVARGRAIFRNFDTPEGSRLVYKPDNQGSFALIKGPISATSR
jgi:hypothetical protein